MTTTTMEELDALQDQLAYMEDCGEDRSAAADAIRAKLRLLRQSGVECDACEGEGLLMCGTCSGTGDGASWNSATVCGACRGSGEVRCGECGGEGTREVEA